jgi:hypothetical protein
MPQGEKIPLQEREAGIARAAMFDEGPFAVNTDEVYPWRKAPA